MKKFILFVTAFLLIAPYASAAERATTSSKSSDYSEVMGDVPIMDGMYEDPQPRQKEAPDQFVDPNRTSAHVVHGNDKTVKSFYNQELRNDGWKPASPQTPNTYVNKAGDILEIEAVNDMKGGANVTFTRTPAAQSPDSNSSSSEGEEDVTTGTEGQ